MGSPDPVLRLDELVPKLGDLGDSDKGFWLIDHGEDVMCEFQGQVAQKVAFKPWRDDVGKVGELRGGAVEDKVVEEDHLSRWVQSLERKD